MTNLDLASSCLLHMFKVACHEGAKTEGHFDSALRRSTHCHLTLRRQRMARSEAEDHERAAASRMVPRTGIEPVT